MLNVKLKNLLAASQLIGSFSIYSILCSLSDPTKQILHLFTLFHHLHHHRVSSFELSDKTMKVKLWFLMLALQILVWISEATRSFPQTDAISHPGPEEAPQSSPYATSEPIQPNKKGMAETMVREEEYERRRVGKVGSSPPRCEHKCYGCTPCEAIQVPSISRRSHLVIQYANYEPESWKCKCGPSFYSP